ncbi:MAG TPA: VCBS repeat-containing protein, partial [Flavobacteriales bacterium]
MLRPVSIPLFFLLMTAVSGQFGEPQLLLRPYLLAPSLTELGDLDGDGDLDAVVTTSGGEIHWFANDGAAGFDTSFIIDQERANAVRVLILADMDGDGDLDILTSESLFNVGVPFVILRRNDGAGNFEAPLSICEHDQSLRPMVVLDLEGDGDLDVAGIGAVGSVACFRNNGTGVLGEAELIPIPFTARPELTTGDLDNEGHTDLICTSNVDHTISWLRSENGSLTPCAIIGTDAISPPDQNEYPDNAAVGCADIDGDGDQDIIVASGDLGELSAYDNQGGGTFGPRHVLFSVIMSTPRKLLSMDMDMDGDMDVVLIKSSNASWFRNDGPDGFFGSLWLSDIPFTESGTITSEYLSLGDLDGDLDPDLLSPAGTVTVAINNGMGNLSDIRPVTEWALGACDVIASDIDNDDDEDIISVSRTDGQLLLFRNLGPDGFEAQHRIATEVNIRTVISFDSDLDGDIDLVVGSYFGIFHYSNLGGGLFGEKQVIATEPETTSLDHADLNGDGWTDIIYGSLEDDEVGWMRNDGNGNFSAPIPVAPDAERIEWVGCSDIDADGDMDILALYGYEDQMTWLQNDGSGNFIETVLLNTIEYPTHAAIGDLDGDGDLDIAVINDLLSDSQLSWYENVDMSFTVAHDVITDGTYFKEVVCSDLNGDGHMDLVVPSWGASSGA